jgi:hypothetical protein
MAHLREAEAAEAIRLALKHAPKKTTASELQAGLLQQWDLDEYQAGLASAESRKWVRILPDGAITLTSAGNF